MPDRLGPDTIDVASSVADREGRGIRVRCLALGGADITNSTGKLTMGVIKAVTQLKPDPFKRTHLSRLGSR